jgi:hypothetical protein
MAKNAFSPNQHRIERSRDSLCEAVIHGENAANLTLLSTCVEVRGHLNPLTFAV